uniref:ABC transporter ATP-binding protein n=1 Tax=Agrobacterium albertimagni TaxID=147266 RepID=A0A7C1NYI2_9HYPH
MGIASRVYGPFERIIKPLEIAPVPLTGSSATKVVLAFAKPFRSVLLLLALLTISVEVISLGQIWLVAAIVDGVSVQGIDMFLGSHTWQFLTLAILIFPTIPMLSFLSNAVGNQCIATCLPAAMQWQAHGALKKQDVAFFHNTSAGQLSSRVTQLASSVQQQLVVAVQSLPSSLIKAIGSIILLGALSWTLAVPVTIWFIVVLLLSVLAVPKFTLMAKETARARSELAGTLTDIYGHMPTIKLFSAERDEDQALRKAFEGFVVKQQGERRVYLSTDFSFVLVNSFLWLAILAISVSGLRSGALSIGDFVGAVTVVTRLTSTSRAFLAIGQQLFQSLGVIRDVLPSIAAVPQITDHPLAKPLKVTRGDIRFESVSFGYGDRDFILRDLDLVVRGGEKVGIVGHSGVGKSTLMNLLLRMFDPVSGRITVDDQDIREVTQDSLRRSIGVVTQESSLMFRSIADNIALGQASCSREEIRAAATKAKAAEFIEQLADTQNRRSYDSFVGERGIKLSGGQRQRVAIARVMLKNAPILILDEATSALDGHTEREIQKSLEHLMVGKTVLAIAHRLSTIKHMDRIIVLNEGRICEEGTLDELLEMKGLFFELWRTQQSSASRE